MLGRCADAVAHRAGRRSGPATSGARPDRSNSSRAEIHQATGIVLAQLGSARPQAPSPMRGYAFVEQRLLIDVARDVVARRLVFTPDMT